jgi:nucleotidyltransferase/DNA polymerase involved in DNA repair
MNKATRKIIHIDADAFLASVVFREIPQYAPQPVAVCGQPKSRGVSATW